MSDKLPWFPLYVDRLMGSRKTRSMDAGKFGIYMLLLIEEWDSGGPLTTKKADLEEIGRAPYTDVLVVLKRCFVKTPDGWVNEALEGIRSEQVGKRKQYQNAGRTAAKARWNKEESCDRNATAMPSHTSREEKRIKEKKKTTLSVGDYDEAFEGFWATYPKRPNPNKKATHRKWVANIRGGETVEAMTAGAQRYAKYCREKRTEPEYIKAAETFLGPDEHWKTQWIVTESDRVKEPTGFDGKAYNEKFEKHTRDTAQAVELERVDEDMTARILGSITPDQGAA